MSSSQVPAEFDSPFASGVPSRTSGAGIDQSRPTDVASGTLSGGGVRLFDGINVVDRRDASSVIKLDFASLGEDICGGAIGGGGVKMCVKPVRECAVAKHRNIPGLFVPKNISSSNEYVVITVSGRNKNEVWLTTSATIEKAGLRYEQAWKNETRSK